MYNYPKVFLYVSAIGLVWLYTHRGSRLHVSPMAALTAVAFLLRHDHGVYIAGMMVCFLGLREWGGAQLWRRLALYAGVTAGLVLPYLVFVQTTTGLVSFVGGSGQQALGECLFPVILSGRPAVFQARPVGAPLGARARARSFGQRALDRGSRRRRSA